MDKNLKETWVEALRSGEFKQGQMKLKDEDCKYCCLGVLCEILPNLEFEDEPECGRFALKDTMDTTSLPTAELSGEDALMTCDEECRLIKMNDSGSSFEEIADYIEKNL